MAYENIGTVKNSVGYSLFKRVFSIYIIIAILITAFHMYSEYNSAKAAIFKNMKNTEVVLQKQLISSVWNMNYDSVEDIIEGILTSDYIIGVSIWINDGVTKGNFGVVSTSKRIEENISFKNSIEVIYKNNLYSNSFNLQDKKYDDGAVLGSVTLYSSEEVIYERVKSNFILILVNSFIKTFALWMIFLFFAKRYLSLPLLNIIKTTSSVNFHKLDKVKFEYNQENQSEFDILKKTFNTMFRKLHLANQENLELNRYLEQKVAKRTQQLEASLMELKEAQDKLIEVEKMASLGSLVAGVAHEINTPVGVGITGISHLIVEANELEEKYKNERMSQTDFEGFLLQVKELSKVIDMNLERTANIIKNFKQVAIDQTSEQKRVFKVKDYVKGILFSIDNIVKKKDVDIKIECDEKLEIDSFPGFFAQILTNLIINSVRHGIDKKGEILIKIDLENSRLNLLYKDNGKGIPKQNLPKIFDPFFTTSREEGGSGLGLSIVYNLVTSNLKGSISCQSSEGKGVEFKVSFPLK